MGSKIGFAVPQSIEIATEGSLADLTVVQPEVSASDVFTALNVQDVLSSLQSAKDQDFDRTICQNAITVLDTFRVAAQEVTSFVVDNGKQIREWQESDTPRTRALIANYGLVGDQVRQLGELATAVVKAPENYLGANDRLVPATEKPDNYIFDVANVAHRLIGELGRKADMFCAAVESFRLDLAEFGRFADKDRLRDGEVTSVKKQALSIDAQARSFERDMFTIDGPEGSRALRSEKRPESRHAPDGNDAIPDEAQ